MANFIDKEKELRLGLQLETVSLRSSGFCFLRFGSKILSNMTNFTVLLSCPQYEEDYDFGNFATAIKPLLDLDPNATFVVTRCNNTAMYAGEPFHVPVLHVLKVPEGSKLPPLISNEVTGTFNTFDKLRLAVKPIGRVAPRYTGSGEGDPTRAVDEYLGGRVSILVGTGAVRRSQLLDPDEVSMMQNAKLVDCRPGVGPFKERYFKGDGGMNMPPPTKKTKPFEVELDGNKYQISKESDQSEEDVLDEFFDDYTEVADTPEHREIILKALQRALKMKDESIQEAIESIGRSRPKAITNIQLIAVVAPRNVSEVVKAGATQKLASSEYKNSSARSLLGTALMNSWRETQSKSFVIMDILYNLWSINL